MEQRKRLESITIYFPEFKEDIKGIITNYYCLSNFQATILLCARIAEKLLKNVCNKTNRSIGEGGLLNLINILKKGLPQTTFHSLHILRVFSNEARHGGNDDGFSANDVSLSVDALLNILGWYNDNYGNSENDIVNVSETTRGNVLIWGDIGFHYITNLIKKTTKTIASENLNFIHVKQAEDFIKLNLEEYQAIILINTEVTKLSSNDSIRDEINELIFQYVKNGGRLIGTHDVVYHRTRNAKLQELFGITINNFERTDKNNYLKSELVKNNGLFESLPDEFQLSDGEICWGSYTPDIITLFENGKNMPLVTCRHYEKGICFWMMSGDKIDDYSPVAICKPEKEFINLLCELLLLDSEELY